MRLYDILIAHDAGEAKRFTKLLEGKDPLFICVIATTRTAKLPGISAAGKTPELTDYTPVADVEYLLTGRCACLDALPVTPEGIPTPALITRVALRLAKIPAFIVNAGSEIEPGIPHFHVGGKPGSDIRTGKAVDDVENILKSSTKLGQALADLADYLVVGESIPGGTTTALAVLLALGLNAEGKVSSSMPDNPHELKVKVAEQALKAAGVKAGEIDPVEAISAVGDPMMPAFAGIVLGAANKAPVLLAGGTQTAAILAVIRALNQEEPKQVAIGTTRWIIDDPTSDLVGLVKQVAEIPILAANLSFASSKHAGLRAYESGAVKEGVGAGGACIAAMLKSRGEITANDIAEAVEHEYGRIVQSF